MTPEIKKRFELFWVKALKESFDIDKDDFICQECGLGQNNEENKKFKEMILSFIQLELNARTIK